MILIITRREWWYRSSTILAQAINTIACWYHSSEALHDDIIRPMHYTMIPFLICIAWWYLSSHAVYDDTIHHMYCIMIPIITRSAWWYHSLHALHDDALHSKTPSSASPLIRHEEHSIWPCRRRRGWSSLIIYSQETILSYDSGPVKGNWWLLYDWLESHFDVDRWLVNFN